MYSVLQPVLLQPVLDSIQTDINLEPQFVRVRSNNISYLTLDSQVCYNEIDATNILISSVSAPGVTPQPLISGVSRLGILDFSLNYSPVNVNGRNQDLGFYYNVSGTYQRYNITMPTGNYTTITMIMNELISLMNVATGNADIFSYAILTPPQNPLRVTITAASKFYFDNTTDGVKYGINLWNLPPTGLAGAATTQTIGPVRLIYSQYVQVVSDDLCQWIKNPNQTNNRINSNVVITFGTQFSGFTDRYPVINWINWNKLASTFAIRFRMYDQFGLPFIYENTNDGTQGGLNFNMTIALEK